MFQLLSFYFQNVPRTITTYCINANYRVLFTSLFQGLTILNCNSQYGNDSIVLNHWQWCQGHQGCSWVRRRWWCQPHGSWNVHRCEFVALSETKVLVACWRRTSVGQLVVLDNAFWCSLYRFLNNFVSRNFKLGATVAILLLDQIWSVLFPYLKAEKKFGEKHRIASRMRCWLFQGSLSYRELYRWRAYQGASAIVVRIMTYWYDLFLYGRGTKEFPIHSCLEEV